VDTFTSCYLLISHGLKWCWLGKWLLFSFSVICLCCTYNLLSELSMVNSTSDFLSEIKFLESKEVSLLRVGHCGTSAETKTPNLESGICRWNVNDAAGHQIKIHRNKFRCKVQVEHKIQPAFSIKCRECTVMFNLLQNQYLCEPHISRYVSFWN
jgi:hypothetical protein